ncbi:MAG: hypothetical protein ACR2LJ_07960 [Acidimicrobiales bacterium]
MERKRKVPGPDGQMHDATELGYRATGEYWNEYLLDDGTIVRLKPIVVQVLRIDGVYDEEGTPVYAVKANNVVVSSAPDELMRKEGEQ